MLTQLDVRGVGLGAAQLPLLAAGLRQAVSLQSLDMSGGQCVCCLLFVLTIETGNGIGAEGGAVLAECIAHCKALTRFVCNGCVSGRESCVHLSDTFRSNNLGNDGVRSLMGGLASSKV